MPDLDDVLPVTVTIAGPAAPQAATAAQLAELLLSAGDAVPGLADHLKAAYLYGADHPALCVGVSEIADDNGACISRFLTIALPGDFRITLQLPTAD